MDSNFESLGRLARNVRIPFSMPKAPPNARPAKKPTINVNQNKHPMTMQCFIVLDLQIVGMPVGLGRDLSIMICFCVKETSTTRPRHFTYSISNQTIQVNQHQQLL